LFPPAIPHIGYMLWENGIGENAAGIDEYVRLPGKPRVDVKESDKGSGRRDNGKGRKLVGGGVR
jgi:hypothetical protein